MHEIYNLTPDQQLEMKRVGLVARIVNGAEVRDAERGFVFCSEVNNLVASDLLKDAAIVVAGEFLAGLPDELQPNKVLGVSNRGKEFATALGLETGLPIVVTDRRAQSGLGEGFQHLRVEAIYNKGQDVISLGPISSFTKGFGYQHELHGLRPGDNVLIADDFCAHGHVAFSFNEGLEDLDITPAFAFLVAKDFKDLNPPQTGFRQLREHNIPAFAVIRLTGIDNNRVFASLLDIS